MMKSFESLKYLAGFDSEFQSEDPRTPGALPYAQNTPQKVFIPTVFKRASLSARMVSMPSNFLVQPSLLRGNITIEVGSTAFYPLLNTLDLHRQRIRKSLNGIRRTPIQTRSDGSPSKFQRNQLILCRVCTQCAVPEIPK